MSYDIELPQLAHAAMVDAEKILNELIDTVINEEGIDNAEVIMKPISSGGANYTSTLHLITIKSPGKQDLELFAKVACLGENIRKTMNADKFFDTERFVYRDLKKIYERLQIENHIPEDERLVFPKFYACRDKYLEDTLILENLVKQGYSCYDRLKPVTWDYAEAAVAEMAKLHALSHAFAEEDPERFAKIASEKKMEFAGSEDEMLAMWDKAVLNVWEATPEELKERLKIFLDKESGVENFLKYYDPPRQPVLVHGDYRASNLMHKMKDGKVEKLIPVDYQTLHSGSPLNDLIYFIFSGTDGTFRKQHFNQLIDHYYNTFVDFLTKLGLKPDTIYPRQDFDEDFKKNLQYGLLLIIFLLPIVLVEAQYAPKIDGDAVFSDFVVKPNEMFKVRFSEAVTEFADMGVI